MNGNAFDAFARQAAKTVSRRTSLLTLGGAALGAAVVAPTIAVAGDTGEKAKKKCKKQGGQCRTFFAEEACPGSPNPDECEDKAFQCCNALAQCRVAAFFDCLFTP